MCDLCTELWRKVIGSWLLVKFLTLQILGEVTRNSFLNWSIIDVQCHVSFRCIANWFSYAYVCVCIYIYIYIYICLCVYIYIYIHTYTEKAMSPYSSTLACKIPWTEEPDRLQSMGSQTVGHDWATSLSFFTFMHWRRKWQLTPVFLPGESQGRGSLLGCRLWSYTESDTTEAT